MNYQDYIETLKKKYDHDAEIFPKEWKISEKLVKKVSIEGFLQPFYGYTSVFKLEEKDIEKCCNLRNALYKGNEGLLVDLPIETYHITLHTFWNQNNSGSVENVDKRMQVSFPEIKRAYEKIKTDYSNLVIRMRAWGVSSDGSDVVSIKFVPSSEEDYNNLMPLFEMMEKICPLNQPYVPHVSLGYFKVRNYTKDEIQRLFSAIQKLSYNHEFEVEMKVSNLIVALHKCMDKYNPVIL